MSAEAAGTTVRVACPHDCPDTCAMLVTVDESGGITLHYTPNNEDGHKRLLEKLKPLRRRDSPFADVPKMPRSNG